MNREEVIFLWITLLGFGNRKLTLEVLTTGLVLWAHCGKTWNWIIWSFRWRIFSSVDANRLNFLTSWLIGTENFFRQSNLKCFLLIYTKTPGHTIDQNCMRSVYRPIYRNCVGKVVEKIYLEGMFLSVTRNIMRGMHFVWGQIFPLWQRSRLATRIKLGSCNSLTTPEISQP